jgi:hypothetical protein
VTFVRLISPTIRSALVIAAGTALILVPFPAGAGAGAIVTGVLVGVLTVALGLAGTASEGRGTIPLSAQAAYDRVLATGLLLLAGGFGLAGDAAATATFAGAGLLALAVTAVTSYSAAAT